MELAMRWHRLRLALNMVVGILIGLGVAFFIVGNVSPVDVHWRIPTAHGYLLDWSLHGVSLWFLGIVPLLVGVAVGYLYLLPARMHHFREHMRHRQRVHELEHELKDLRTSFDSLLMMPEDGRLAVPAALLPPMEPEPEPEPQPAALEVLAAPAAVRAAVVSRPPRNGKAANGKAANGKPKPVSNGVSRSAAKPVRGSVPKPEAKKSG
jgi:uncharacterized membrane-anchored protein YhcB (DUF1043 family)